MKITKSAIVAVLMVLAVAAVGILLITNRENTTSEQNPAQPTTTAPDTTADNESNTSDVEPPSDERVLKTVFGDGKWVEDIQDYLVWTPTGPDAKETWGDWHKDKYPLNSQVLASTTIRTGSANDKHIVLTRTGRRTSPLNATQPFGQRKLGAFTFQYDGTGWDPIYSEPIIESTYDGIYGSSVVSIGPKDNQFAFVIRLGTSASGTNGGSYLLLAHINNKIQNILDRPDDLRWGYGAVGSYSDKKSYEYDYDTTFEFVESDTSQFYDMIATTEGVKGTGGSVPISTTTISEQTRYRFQGGRYQAVSSTTDLTKTGWTDLQLKPLKNSNFSDEHGLFATTENGEVIIKRGFDYRSTIEDYGAGLKAVITSCGSPCSTTIFVDLESGETSSGFQSVVAVDEKNKHVAVAEKRSIAIHNIFESDLPVLEIRRNFAPTAAPVSAIEEARFTDEGNLFIRYQSGEDFETKSETIEVDTKDGNITGEYDGRLTTSCQSGGTTVKPDETIKNSQTWLGKWKYSEGYEMHYWIYELEVNTKDGRLVGDLTIDGHLTSAGMRIQIVPIENHGSAGVVFKEFKSNRRNVGVPDFQRDDLLFTLSKKDPENAVINWCGLDSHELDYESDGTSRTGYNQQPAFKLQTGKGSEKAGVETKEIRSTSCQGNITNIQNNKTIQNPQFWRGEWLYSQGWEAHGEGVPTYTGHYWTAALDVNLENNNPAGDIDIESDAGDNARMSVNIIPIENSDSVGVVFQELHSEDWHPQSHEEGDLLFTLKKADEDNATVSWCTLSPPELNCEHDNAWCGEYNQQPAFELNE